MTPAPKETFMTFAICFGQFLCGTPLPDALSLLEEMKMVPRFKLIWDECERITAENNLKRIRP